MRDEVSAKRPFLTWWRKGLWKMREGWILKGMREGPTRMRMSSEFMTLADGASRIGGNFGLRARH